MGRFAIQKIEIVPSIQILCAECDYSDVVTPHLSEYVVSFTPGYWKQLITGSARFEHYVLCLVRGKRERLSLKLAETCHHCCYF